jgi:hypothetical protein
MPVSGTITQVVNLTHTINDDISVPSDQIASGAALFPTLTTTYTDGTAAGQANKIWRDYRTLTAGSNDDLDLSGSLTNFHGDATVFTGIKEIIIAVVSPDGTKKLKVGNATNAFNGPLSSSGTIEVPYHLRLSNPSAGGWTVTAGTGDILRVNNPGASSVDYCIVIVGI